MTLRSLPAKERPRERLARYGGEGVSTIELLAILLGSGTQERSVLELAAEVLRHFGSLKHLAEATIAELRQVKGIGLAKATQLQAAFQLFRRLAADREEVVLSSPRVVYQLIRSELEWEATEVLMLVLRDVKRRLVHREVLGRGTLTELLVHPREVFCSAIRHRAHTAIIAHNHPSGDPTPSLQDLEMTELLSAAGRVVGIDLVDHLIVGKNTFVSFYLQGRIQRKSY
jgi:DNA repair protein RadC